VQTIANAFPFHLLVSRTLVENADDQEVETNNEATKDYNEDINPTTLKTVQQNEETETDVARTEKDDDGFSFIPDLCEGHFDSVAFINNAIYVFKESFIWEFNLNFELEDSFPKKILKVFPNFPKRFQKIDAVYEIPNEDEIVFFSGSEYITYDIRGPIYTAYNITRYTYDPDIKKIDVAMIWCKL
jgi:Hemopexin